MECRFSFKHMKSSDSLIEYAEPKIRLKIEKLVSKPIEAHITFSVDGHTHLAHCNVVGGEGLHCQVEASSPDMYASLDLMLDKLEGQLKKQKEKLKNHKHQHNVKDLPIKETEDDWEAVPVDAADLLKYEKAKES